MVSLQHQQQEEGDDIYLPILGQDAVIPPGGDPGSPVSGPPSTPGAGPPDDVSNNTLINTAILMFSC